MYDFTTAFADYIKPDTRDLKRLPECSFFLPQGVTTNITVFVNPWTSSRFERTSQLVKTYFTIQIGFTIHLMLFCNYRVIITEKHAQSGHVYTLVWSNSPFYIEWTSWVSKIGIRIQIEQLAVCAQPQKADITIITASQPTKSISYESQSYQSR